MSVMRKTKRMLSLPQDHFHDMSKFPLIYPQQFKQKFNALLQKVTIQNKYANRISQCNIKNMEQLQRARQQLQKIANQKKMQELSLSTQKQMLNQLSLRLNRNQDQLQNVFKELIDSKRQIKALKRQIANLQKNNSQLERQLMILKRKQAIQQSRTMEINQDAMLSKMIKNYMEGSINRHSFMYRYCQKIDKKYVEENIDINTSRKDIQRQLSSKIQNIQLKSPHQYEKYNPFQYYAKSTKNCSIQQKITLINHQRKT